MTALAVALGAAANGCDGCSKREEAPVAPAAAVVEAPVSAPSGELFEATIATPDATWGRVQRGAGGAAGILPSTLGGLACAASGIDPSLASEVDGASPAYAVVAGDLSEPAWAIAMRLADPRARSRLVEGDAAKLAARDVAGMARLEERGAGSGRAVAAIAKSGWLVVAKDDASLAALGPYATRTMPTRALVAEAASVDAPGTALAGALKDALARAWTARKAQMLASDTATRAQHGDRAPDFADPRAIVASVDGVVASALDVLGDAKDAHVGVDADDASVRASLTAAPASADGPARRALQSVKLGDASPLLALPMNTMLAVFARDDADARAKQADAVAGAMDAALGGRWKPADAKRVRDALTDWAKGRGDWTALALVWGAAKGALVASPASDAERATRALGEAMDTESKRRPSARRSRSGST